MTATKKTLSAAAVATTLVLTACISDAQAQFGRMGMGMMGGPMGMFGPMGMGRIRPGMGSARSWVIEEPGQGARRSRSYRSRDRYEEPPRKEHATAAKPKATIAAPVQSTRATFASAPQQAPAAKPVATVQPTQNIQPPQNTLPTQASSVTKTLPEAVAPAPPAADTALPVRITPQTRPLNCMTKLHLKDGTVILQDFCTLEQAVIKQGETSQLAQPHAMPPAPPQQARPQPQQIQSQQSPALLARSR